MPAHSDQRIIRSRSGCRYYMPSKRKCHPVRQLGTKTMTDKLAFCPTNVYQDGTFQVPNQSVCISQYNGMGAPCTIHSY